jgi:hypothetical protein
VGGSVPLPFLPDIAAEKVRGAMLFDLARAQGVALTEEAREILSTPGSETNDATRLLGSVGRFVARRMLKRFGPIALLAPVRTAIGTWVAGHLFHRYLELHHPPGETVLSPERARRVRRAIDRALLHAVSIGAKTEGPWTGPKSPDDRDDATRIFDAILTRIAAGPEFLGDRLDRAFDDLLARTSR